MSHSAGPDPYSPHTGSTEWAPLHYDLDLTVKLGGNRLDGVAKILLEALVPLKRVELDLVGLGVTKASVDGKKTGFKATPGKVKVELPHKLAPGERVTVAVTYGGSPGPRLGPWGDVGWEELDDGVLVAGQPDGASTWFPCNDTARAKATYAVSVSTDADYRAVANGRLVGHRRRSSRETFSYIMDEPMSPYLATLQIGRYREVTLAPTARVLVPAELQVRATTAFAKQAAMVAALEGVFGPYPFSEPYTALVTADELEIPLEAQGLSIFGRNHLSTEWEAQRLIAHELAHQWFGNSVTAASWRDTWMHEGFACFAEWVWSESSGGWPVRRRAHAAWEGLAKKPQDLVIGDPGAEDMFDDRVYKRGALAVYALLLAAGDDAHGLLAGWCTRNRFEVVTREDFEDYLRSVSPGGVDLVEVIRPWLDEENLPAFPER